MLGVAQGNVVKGLFWPPRLLLLVPLLALIGAAAGLAYWYRADIEAAYVSVRTEVIGALGLSIVPLTLWSTAFVIAAVWRRNWLRRANIWAGLLFLTGAVAGFLSFYQPATGWAAAFTLNGQVSLGGDLGETLSGSATAVGVLRVVGIAALSAVLALPKLASDVAVLGGRALASLYVLLALALRSFVRSMGRMYRFEPESSLDRSRRSRADLPLGSSDPNMTASMARARPDRDLESRASVPEFLTTTATVDEQAMTVPVTETVEVDESDLESDVIVSDDPDSIFERNDSPVVEESPNGKVNRFWTSAEEESPAEDAGPSEITVDVDEADDSPPISTVPWKLPSQNLLVDAVEGDISEEEMADTGETIRRTLAEYGVEVESGEIKPGPAVTMYGLIPGWVRRYKQAKVLDEKGNPKLDQLGKAMTTRVETKTRVKVDSILSREKDLALALRTPSIRIETPVMGKSMVGIEVPNPEPALVTLGNVMRGREFKRLRGTARLPIALGKGSGGETVVVDLAKMPHLLVAGATGSGKSVFINTVVSALLMEKSPAEMRLLMVDPKRVELTPYNGVPHLLTPVVVETDKVVGLLKGLIQEMFNRYRRMEEVRVRNIDGYNKKRSEQMPYIVVAIDELADLMMTAAFDVEQSLCRLAQLGRATGIHLVVATQRPSVDVVTGLIKANFPSRVSFGVTSQIDSRTILDTAGAEKLLGRGDMLYQSQDASRPERVQGVFISDSEIEDLVNFWQTTSRRPLPNIPLRVVTNDDVEDGTEAADVNGARDELIDKVLELAQNYNKLSTSLLQRRLRIGYPRAARLMDQLEEQGIIGPSDGSKSRDVIISQA